MAVIRIQERDGQTEGFSASVSFDYGPEYPVTIQRPFSKEQEEQLAWYFEDYLAFPFTKQVKAQEAAASITTYGETLFKQIFANPDEAGLPEAIAPILGITPSEVEEWLREMVESGDEG